VHTAAGCAECGWTGYRGRTGIYELMTIDEHLRRLIHDARSEPEIRDHLEKQGMRSLRVDGMRWVSRGVTSIEEVLRVTRESTQLVNGVR
jgi:general secretion pathway protein E